MNNTSLIHKLMCPVRNFSRLSIEKENGERVDYSELNGMKAIELYELKIRLDVLSPFYVLPGETERTCVGIYDEEKTFITKPMGIDSGAEEFLENAIREIKDKIRASKY